MADQRVGSVEISVEEGVVRATIDRPRVRNAIDDSVVEGLAAALHMADSTSARVLVLRGSGGTFSSGADLKYAERFDHDPAALEAFLDALASIAADLENGDFASVAVVEGHAVAGGFELMLACDIVVGSEAAVIGDIHVRSALLPALGTAARLLRIGNAPANYLLLTGRTITGAQAASWGLWAAAQPAAQLDSYVGQLVDELAAIDARTMSSIKSAIRTARTSAYDVAVQQEMNLSLAHAGAKTKAARD
jgi:enoyl-CoA hydratase/carnithine racemase